MTHVSKITVRKISLARGILCCPNSFLFLSPDHYLYIVNNVCIYTHIPDCVDTACALPLIPNNNAVKHVYTYWERCKVCTVYLSLGRRPSGDRATGQTFYSLLFKQEAIAATFTATCSCLIAFLEEAFIRNILTILCINYNMH